MAIVGYVAPDFRERSFTCPHCSCFSQQEWLPILLENGTTEAAHRWLTSRCLRCEEYSFWKNEKLIWPMTSGLPDPVDDCPKQIRAVYDEARQVFPASPRASAALLRLAIQLICVERGLPGKDLNSDIGALVKAGLPAQIQQSLDLVRVVGNHAVHPGQIVIEDNKHQIEKFFVLVNLIIDLLILQPAKVDTMFTTLVPAPRQKQIAARDGKP